MSDIDSDSVAVCLMPLHNPFPSENDAIPLIYSKNADVPGHPASVTKVMNAITALDYLTDLDEKIVFQESDITPGMGSHFNGGGHDHFKGCVIRNDVAIIKHMCNCSSQKNGRKNISKHNKNK